MRKLTTASFLTLASFLASAQSVFQNLDFELTTIEQTQVPGTVSVSSSLPGWTVFYGTNVQTSILYGTTTLGATSVDLLGTNAALGLGYRGLEGNFGVLLQGGVSGSGPNLYPTAAIIEQMGLVPLGSRSIQFIAQNDSSGSLLVSLGGVNIPYFAVSNAPNYTVYRGDISAFVGSTLELKFSVSRLPDRAQGNWNIDSILFSDLSVPEPRAIPLFSCGAMILGWRLLRSRR